MLFFNGSIPVQSNLIPNNLNDVMKAAISLTEKQAAKSLVSIDSQLCSTMPIVPIDADRLKEVILNLLLNAVQAMPKGGTISIKTWEKKNIIGFSIKDTGNGIEEQYKSKIFDPFFTTKKQGTGLGLAIVKQLIQSMDGDILLKHSTAGTYFDVWVPYDTTKDTNR